MSDYQQGKIYKLYVEGVEDFCYIGSTTESLSERLCKHRNSAKYESQNKTTACAMFENDNNVLISLIEDYPCNSKKELEEREKYWLLQFPDAINKNIPTQTWQERWYKNHEHNLTRQNKYKKDNKEYLSEQQKQRRLDNLEEHRKRDRDRRNANKDKINAKKKEKVECPECKKIMNKNSLWEHKKKVHIE